MNILIIAHYQGDGSPNAIFIHDQVKEYIKLGHNVRAIVPIAVGKKGYFGSRFDKIVTKIVIDGVEITFLRYLSLSKYGIIGFNGKSATSALNFNLDKILREFKVNIIHAHTINFDGKIGVWLKQKLQVPLAITTHGSDTSILIEKGKGNILKKVCDKADAVVAVSNALKKKIDTCNTTTPTYSILNGFSVENISNDCKKIPYSFIQVGNLIEQKKFDVTIKAFSKIHQIYSNATLTIIGRGSEEENLKKLCKELGINESVKFLGQIPNSKVLEEMARAEFFIMPSIREGFGIVYLEAMASSCVTIGTQGEGIGDLIINGENGILVNPNDYETIVKEVLHCIKNNEYMNKIAENGKISVKSLTWRNNAKKYIELFEKLIAKE